VSKFGLQRGQDLPSEIARILRGGWQGDVWNLSKDCMASRRKSSKRAPLTSLLYPTTWPWRAEILVLRSALKNL